MSDSKLSDLVKNNKHKIAVSMLFSEAVASQPFFIVSGST